jgi:glycosyltransferase involved in cell wall biosynthesis
VLWVNTVGLREPRLTWYDVKRGTEVIAGWLRARPADVAPGPSSPSPAPRVLRPFMLPFFQWRWASALNRRLLTRALHRALHDFAPGKRRILVSTLPIAGFAFRDPAFARTIYYCVDDFTTWPGVSGETMLRLEAEVVEACDLLVATSTALLESRGPRAKASRLLTHGVDADRFARPTGTSTRLSDARPPVIGMFGVIDARLDSGIVAALAKAMPDATIVLLGPVDRDVRDLTALSNVRLAGAVPYDALPAEAAQFDVCILPYVVDASTTSINPLKLKEYLATGKPVVSTPLPEAERLRPFVRVAAADAFVDAVAAALRDPMPAPGLSAFLAGESWDAKASQFFDWAVNGV